MSPKCGVCKTKGQGEWSRSGQGIRSSALSLSDYKSSKWAVDRRVEISREVKAGRANSEAVKVNLAFKAMSLIYKE